MFCSHCGAGLPDHAAVCPACGRGTLTGVLTMDADATRLGTAGDLATLSHAGATVATGYAAHTALPSAPTSGVVSAPAFGAPLAPGSAFGSRYHLIRLLGVGGMGAV